MTVSLKESPLMLISLVSPSFWISSHRLHVLGDEEYIDGIAEELCEHQEDVDKSSYEWRPRRPAASSIYESSFGSICEVQEDYSGPPMTSLERTNRP